MEAQRAEFPVIGGFLQLTSLTRRNVSTRILRRWACPQGLSRRCRSAFHGRLSAAPRNAELSSDQAGMGSRIIRRKVHLSSGLRLYSSL
jgi:hypothetical protein